MKILIVTAGFFPGQKHGGPPVSVDNFCSLLNDCECYIITRDHDLGEKTRYKNIDFGWNDRGNCKVFYLSDAEYRRDVFERMISEIKPDIIYLQSLFQSCTITCLTIAKKYKIRVLLAPRGELCKGAFRKKNKKIPYIAVLRIMGLLKNIYFQSTSEEETQAIKKYLGASLERIFFLTNIPSIAKQTFEYSEKKEGEAKFVFLSRIHPKKNLIQAIKCLNNVKGNVTFDVYGPLEDEGYWELCQNEIKALPDNIKVNYCGLVTHDEVHKTFSRYDAFLFPTFSENYGHVIIEALISGCPVVLSDQTPWNDLEAEGAGYVCALEDVSGFEMAVQSVIDSDSSDLHTRAKLYAEKKMNLKSLKDEYEKALTEIIK